jgi:hypothetical protein
MDHETKPEMFAVWYACVGCLPDSQEPEYVGTFAECRDYVAEHRDDFDVSPHNLYRFSIEPWGDA